MQNIFSSNHRVIQLIKQLAPKEIVRETAAHDSKFLGKREEPIVVYIHQTSIFGSPTEEERSMILHHLEYSSANINIVFDTTPNIYHLLVSGTPKEELISHSNLKAVLTPWSGVIPKTKKLCLKYGIDVFNVHHNSNATAEMAVGLVLAAAKKIIQGHNDMRETKWSLRTSMNHSLLLENKRALILGFGAIGKRVCNVLHALQMEVHCIRRTVRKPVDNGIHMHTMDDLDALIKSSQIIVIALPGTKNTYGLFGRDKLMSMPENCVLVNVGRAKIIDEKDLYECLLSRSDIRFASDVWYKYPKMGHSPHVQVAPSRLPIHELPNVTLSPHRAGQVGEILNQRAKAISDFILAFSEGRELPNKVDLKQGY